MPEPVATTSESELRALVERALAASYEIEKEIGRGGMGIVYRARDRRLKRHVAVKILPPELAFRSEIKSRFLREAETAAQLGHPHIVPIYSVDEAEGLVYFVMACVDGDNLGKRLHDRGPLPIPEVRRILAEVSDALAYAHQRGVVHRDIKPDNILLDHDGDRALVTDFGIARAIIEGSDARLTATGMAIGTPAYMSPEQSAGDREIDGRSDLYSLGVVAYQMLAGELPFQATSTPAMLVKHLSERPTPVDQRRADCPPDLAAIVMRLLEKEPGRRFSGAQELEEVLRGAPVPPPSYATTQPPAAYGTPYGDAYGSAGALAAGTPSATLGGQARAIPPLAPGPTAGPTAPLPPMPASPAAGEAASAGRERGFDGSYAATFGGSGVRLDVAWGQPAGPGGALQPAGPGTPPRGLAGLPGDPTADDVHFPTPEEAANWEHPKVQDFRRKLGWYVIINAVIVVMWLVGGSDLVGLTGLWTVYMAFRYAQLWSDGFDWRDVLRQPKDRLLQDVMVDGAENVGALFDPTKRARLRERARRRRVADEARRRGLPSGLPGGSGAPALPGAGYAASLPADLGMQAEPVRQALGDRDEIVRLLAQVPRPERDRFGDVGPSANALAEKVVALGRMVADLDRNLTPGAVGVLEAEIARLEAEANPLDRVGSEERVKRLAYLKRQRRSVGEMERRRDTAAAKLESCRLALQNMRLDLVRLRSGTGGSPLQVTTVAERALALAHEVDGIVGAADEVRLGAGRAGLGPTRA